MAVFRDGHFQVARQGQEDKSPAVRRGGTYLFHSTLKTSPTKLDCIPYMDEKISEDCLPQKWNICTATYETNVPRQFLKYIHESLKLGITHMFLPNMIRKQACITLPYSSP